MPRQRCRRDSTPDRRMPRSRLPDGRVVRAADGAGLENQWAAMSRGFESHTLRRISAKAERPSSTERHRVSTNNRTRRPVAAHGQLRRPSAWGQLLQLIGIGLAVVLVSGVAIGSYIVYDLSTTFAANAVEIEGQEELPPDIGALEGGINILLVGSDECEDG